MPQSPASAARALFSGFPPIGADDACRQGFLGTKLRRSMLLSGHVASNWKQERCNEGPRGGSHPNVTHWGCFKRGYGERPISRYHPRHGPVGALATSPTTNSEAVTGHLRAADQKTIMKTIMSLLVALSALIGPIPASAGKKDCKFSHWIDGGQSTRPIFTCPSKR